MYTFFWYISDVIQLTPQELSAEPKTCSNDYCSHSQISDASVELLCDSPYQRNLIHTRVSLTHTCYMHSLIHSHVVVWCVVVLLFLSCRVWCCSCCVFVCVTCFSSYSHIVIPLSIARIHRSATLQWSSCAIRLINATSLPSSCHAFTPVAFTAMFTAIWVSKDYCSQLYSQPFFFF